MKHKLSLLALLVVTLIWGGGYAMSALSLDYFTPVQTMAVRFSLAFLGSLLIYWRDLATMRWQQLKPGMWIGLMVFLGFIFQTVGLQYTTASKNAFLTTTNIVFVPLLNLLIFKKHLSRQKWVGVLLVLLGIGLLSIDFQDISQLFSYNIGDGLTLVCALFFAGQIILIDHFLDELSSASLMVGQLGMASFLSWVVCLWQGDLSFSSHPTGWAALLYLTFASTLIAFALQTWAQKYSSPTQVAVILSTEALVGMIASSLILGEPITSTIFIGGILIIVGVLRVELSKN
ncbi:DMT family transporter [Facklamia hominis]|uniref:DMT family transporter n=1 Tax=Facklamia hominis TaxID=178214 RepID=UPI00288B8F8C|nr:DMT family transporter [Facklamia hominis]